MRGAIRDMSDADVVRPVLERALRRVANAAAPVDDALLRQIRADLVEALDLLASGRAPSLQELWASDPQAARERERRAIEKHASASTKSSAAAAPPCRSRALAANGEIIVCGSTDRGHRCRLTSDEYVLLFKDFDKERLAKEAAARAERRKRQRQNQENVGPAQNST